MDSNLCIICFVNDDHHQVNVGEKGLETLLWYIKLHFDEKLERLFSKSSQWFMHAICRHDYTTFCPCWRCSTKQEDQTKTNST